VYIADTNERQEVFVRSLDSPVSTQLTTSCRDCSGAFWASDGSRVFYTSAGDLFSITPAGGQPQRIIDKVMAAAQAGGGTAIALLRATPANTTLWTAPAPNAALTQYTTPPFPPTFTRSTGIDFSPDGSKIAVLIEQQTGATLSFDIWIAPYPAGRPYRVPLMDQWIAPGSLSASGNRWATRRLGWAADNRHLVFQNTAPQEPGSHLFLVDTKTGATSPITTGTGEEWSPAVSPDGRRIAFTSGSNDLDLLQISFDGAVTNLVATSRSEYAPAWSPTAGRLAYVTTKNGRPELWVRNESDGWSVPLLSGAKDLPIWYALERLVFSPDGRKLAYGAILSGKHVIWVSPIDGGRPVAIDNESPDQHGPAWSPDGNWLSYKRLFNGQWEFVKAPLGGGPVVRLADAPAGGSDTAWSPHGDWLAQLRGQTLELVSADGKSHRVLNQVASAGFGFAPDGSLRVLRRAATDSWEVARIDVRTGQETAPIPVPLPASTTLTGFTLHRDGKSFVTARTTPRFDIWLLDGFDTPRRFWFGLR
jgi:Tol biopolymer transport system component